MAWRRASEVIRDAFSVPMKVEQQSEYVALVNQLTQSFMVDANGFAAADQSGVTRHPATPHLDLVGSEWVHAADDEGYRVHVNSITEDDGLKGASLPTGSWASSAATRKSMQGNRHRDTRPEIAVRSLVHRAGLRYRVAARPLPNLRRTADLVFPRLRLAVFIDGCYWHFCPEHGHFPVSNPGYWNGKLTRNVERDRETDFLLEAAGWKVLRYWEHTPVNEIAAAILDETGRRAQFLQVPRRGRA
jgi:DNA mismatch endonuclease, patch repair protein